MDRHYPGLDNMEMGKHSHDELYHVGQLGGDNK